jgi:polyphosphate kinase
VDHKNQPFQIVGQIKTEFNKKGLRCIVRQYITEGMDERVTFRLPKEISARAETIMNRRGILKLSDFVRQALVSQIRAEESQTVNFATTAAPQTQEAGK